MKIIKICLLFFCFSVLFSCSNSAEKMAAIEKQKQDSLLAVAEKDKAALDNPSAASEKEGVIGVFDVPEMLCLSILDSATQNDVGNKRAKDYGILEEEVKNIGAELDGSPGAIFYNNDPKNFKFECIFLIKEMPPKESKKCKIVALEASKMVIYNYFGSYQNLIDGYNAIRSYCKENNLTQSGPMREFYITDPLLEKDSKKWLTRIMLPVTNKK
jgi:effector-binding domain-containing protein